MNVSRNVALVGLVLPLFLLPVACGDNEPDTQPYECSDAKNEAPGLGGASPATCATPQSPETTIEIVGEYTDDYGGKHKITSSSWNLVNLSYVNNEENYAVGRNDESEEWTPCSWSLLSWHEEQTKLYYCQAVFSADSECEAMGSTLPDPTDLEQGCSGFPWSELTAD